MSRRLVTAAAAIVIGVGSLGGVAAAAGTAEPGSPLWGLSEVVYAERADSLTAKENALDALSQARGLMATDPALARELLAEAARQAAHVRGEDGAEAVRRQIEDLRRALDGDSGSPNSSSSGAGPGLARPGVSPRPDGAQPVAPPPTSSPPTSSPTSPPTQPASPPPSSPPASPTPSPSDPSPSASSSASSGPTSETSPSP